MHALCDGTGFDPPSLHLRTAGWLMVLLSLSMAQHTKVASSTDRSTPPRKLRTNSLQPRRSHANISTGAWASGTTHHTPPRPALQCRCTSPAATTHPRVHAQDPYVQLHPLPTRASLEKPTIPHTLSPPPTSSLTHTYTHSRDDACDPAQRHCIAHWVQLVAGAVDVVVCQAREGAPGGSEGEGGKLQCMGSGKGAGSGWGCTGCVCVGEGVLEVLGWDGGGDECGMMHRMAPPLLQAHAGYALRTRPARLDGTQKSPSKAALGGPPACALSPVK
jgi:hypothetical protein